MFEIRINLEGTLHFSGLEHFSPKPLNLLGVPLGYHFSSLQPNSSQEVYEFWILPNLVKPSLHT